jgi:hypothetical protein
MIALECVHRYKSHGIKCAVGLTNAMERNGLVLAFSVRRKNYGKPFRGKHRGLETDRNRSW